MSFLREEAKRLIKEAAALPLTDDDAVEIKHGVIEAFRMMNLPPKMALVDIVAGLIRLKTTR